MRNLGIGSWPARRARKTPLRTAIVGRHRSLTYGELDERVDRLAHGLATLGVTRGGRVAYLGPNDPAFLETLFATTRLGAVFVPLNTRLAAREIEYMLRDSDTAALVYDPACAATVKEIVERGIACRLLVTGGTAGDAALDYEGVLAAASAAPVDEAVGLDDPCMIMYTSGTTGKPKGATLSNNNVVWNCYNVLVDVDLGADEVTLVTAPMFHTAALNLTCLPTLLKGGMLVIEPAFEPERVIDLIEHHRVTCLFGVPTMFATLAALPRWPDADLSSVRTLLCGGAPVPDVLIRTYLERGFSFIQGYGMTETAPSALLLDKDMVERKAGSAGVPQFFTDVRVVSPDLTDVAPGERGEVLVHGPNVMQGYWGRPEATAEAFAAGGWFRSGDVATLDEDGFAYIVDRMKDVIISGGENVYPAEVENELCHHPAVAECAVVGVPDEKWGEVGKAFVVRRTGSALAADDLLAFLAGRLARYKIPTSVEFVETLPRNPTGKVLRARLREDLAAVSGPPPGGEST